MPTGPAFRSDAHAEDNPVGIVGWDCRKQQQDAKWSSCTLDLKCSPWNFRAGEPFRTMASVELYAMLVSVKLPIERPENRAHKVMLALSGEMDELIAKGEKLYLIMEDLKKR